MKGKGPRPIKVLQFLADLAFAAMCGFCLGYATDGSILGLLSAILVLFSGTSLHQLLERLHQDREQALQDANRDPDPNRDSFDE